MAAAVWTDVCVVARGLVKTVFHICNYVVFTVKLYAIGVFALLLQLTQNSAPNRGLTSLAGRTAVVTGGAAGIGLYLSKHLASLGAQVVIACREKEEAERAISVIHRDCPSAKVEFLPCDLASFSSVQQFAADFKASSRPLHLLINNGGVMLVPFHQTEDGHERHLQVNYLSHVLLTSLLTDLLESSSPAGRCGRVVNVSSVAHHVASCHWTSWTDQQRDDWSYSPHNSYAVSKLALVLYTYALSRRWGEEGRRVTVNAVHPGLVDTALYGHLHWTVAWAVGLLRHYCFMSPEAAALAVLHVATSPQLEGVSGAYFSLGQLASSSPLSHSPSLQDSLWHWTQSTLQHKAPS